MFKILQETAQEVLKALLPIVFAVIVLQVAVLHLPAGTFVRFLIGAFMVTLGVVCFLFGVRTSILPMGHEVGAELSKRGSLLLIIVVALIFGFAVTYSEPSVLVLARLSAAAGNGDVPVFIFVVAAGMAVLFLAALLRVLTDFPIRILLAIIYGVAIVLAMFAPSDFTSIAFDSGAAAAGPFTVPMLLALGLGFVSVLSRRYALSDGFGLIGIACAGPIIGVLAWGVFFF